MDRQYNGKWGAVKMDGQYNDKWGAEMDRQYNDKWGVVNQRDGQKIQWQMRINTWERWTENTMANEVQ